MAQTRRVAPAPPADEGDCSAAPAPLVGTRADLGWALATVSRAFREDATASVADLPGGPRGHLVLATVAQGRPSSQLALAQQLGVDKTVMTYLLDELENAGLVQRRPDPADRRARQVAITPEGIRSLETFGARLGLAEDRLLAALDPADRPVFRDLLDRLATAARTPRSAAEVCLEDPPAPC